MNVIDALRARYSCRAFKPDPVERETLRGLLEVALRSPSWANSQPWEIHVAGSGPGGAIREGFLENSRKGVPPRPDVPRPKEWTPEIDRRREELYTGVSRLGEDVGKRFGELNRLFFNAPAVIYLCMDRHLTAWSVFDLGALSQSIMLAAVERGLATMPAVNLVLYPDVIRRELGIPEGLSVVFGIAIGYADPAEPINRFRTERKPADGISFKGF